MPSSVDGHDGRSARVVLITGAAAGLARGIALAFARDGERVAFTYRPGGTPPDETLALLRPSDPDAVAIPADFAAPDAAAQAVRAAEAARGPVDVLVHAVGPIVVKRFARSTPADYRAMVEGNLGSAVDLAFAVLPGMRTRRYGRLVFFGMNGSSATHPARGMSLYGAAKAGLVTFARALALEEAANGISVNVIEPGDIRDKTLSRAGGPNAPGEEPDRSRRLVGRRRRCGALSDGARPRLPQRGGVGSEWRAHGAARVKYATWIIVASVTLLRGFAAWKLPLTGDEAYYWEWAKHLALGYADHPPMVAYLILPFDWVTANPLFVRLGFLTCGVVATLAAAGAAKRLTGDDRAGMVTALAMTLAPMLSVGFVLTTPDGPLMAGWALCLYLVVRASQTHARRDYVLLGVAIAFALLSKMFAWALVAGIVAWALAPSRRSLWREGLGVSFFVAAILCAPFLAWNAQHHWISFVFAFQQRHVAEPSLLRPFKYLLACAGAYSPGLWIAAMLVLVRPGNALIGWTAIPLSALLILLNAHERIELHWMFGPYVSLAVGLGLAFESLSHRARVLWATAGAVPAAVLIPFLFLAAAFPGQLYSQFLATGSTLSNTGPFEIFTYWSLAQDVKRMASANEAVVVTDGYGFPRRWTSRQGSRPS